MRVDNDLSDKKLFKNERCIKKLKSNYNMEAFETPRQIQIQHQIARNIKGKLPADSLE